MTRTERFMLLVCSMDQEQVAHLEKIANGLREKQQTAKGNLDQARKAGKTFQSILFSSGSVSSVLPSEQAQKDCKQSE